MIHMTYAKCLSLQYSKVTKDVLGTVAYERTVHKPDLLLPRIRLVFSERVTYYEKQGSEPCSRTSQCTSFKR